MKWTSGGRAGGRVRCHFILRVAIAVIVVAVTSVLDLDSATAASPNTPTNLSQTRTNSHALAASDSTKETSVRFTATASDPDGSDTLYLCVEKKALGIALTGTEDSCGSGVAYAGTPVTTTVTLSSLTSGTSYHWGARTKDLAGNYSAWAYFGTNNSAVVDFKVNTSLSQRTNTVEFFAGQSTAATSTDNKEVDLAKQSFALGEKNVEIKQAYVEVTAQVAAINNSAVYTNTYVYFGSCTSSCTPTTAAYGAATSLGGTNGNSTYQVLRADVTADSAVLAYTGQGNVNDFVVGYCFATSSPCPTTGASSETAFAHAKLVVTYTYDPATTTSETATVTYPLESNTDVGSTLGSQAPSCTKDSTCPKFSYNANIPDISSQLSQYFRVSGLIKGSGATDNTFQAQVDSNGTWGSTYTYQGDAGSQSGNLDHYVTGVAGYANNTSQQLELYWAGNASSLQYAQGGENYVTYLRSATASTKTRTAIYPVGDVLTASPATKTALKGPTVYFPESGVTVNKAYFRVHANPVGTAARTLKISTRVGANTETAQTSITLAMAATQQSSNGYLIYEIPSADYAQLAAATATSGKAVQMTAQWGTSGSGIGVSAELVVTYSYTGETGGYTATQTMLNGQQTSGTTAANTSYSMAGFDPSISEASTSGITIRGASLASNIYQSGTTSNTALNVGAALATGACTATSTTQEYLTGDPHPILHFADVTSVVTTTDSQTYNTCGIFKEDPWIYSGISSVVYEVQNQPPSTPSALAQYRADATTSIPTGNWVADSSIVFKATVSDPDSDVVQLCVEATSGSFSSPASPATCGTAVASGATASVTVACSTNTQYRWQVKAKDWLSAYSASYAQFNTGSLSYGCDTTNPTASATVYDGSGAGVDASFNNASLSTLSANWSASTDTSGSGVWKYQYAIGTTAGAADIKAWTDLGNVTSATTSSLVLRTTQMYYTSVRAVDNAGNTGSTTSSDGQLVAPSLTFSAPASLTFAPLDVGNGYTDTKSLSVSVFANGYRGYKLFQSSTVMSSGASSISFNGGVYPSPATWSGNGFGYTSSDTTIDVAGNIYGGATLYARPSSSFPGDLVADHSPTVDGFVTGTPLNDNITLTYKVKVPSTQAAGTYVALVTLSCVAVY